MAGPMKAVAIDAMGPRHLCRDCVGAGDLRNRGVKSSVENRNLWDFWQEFRDSFDADDIRWIMQRREGT